VLAVMLWPLFFWGAIGTYPGVMHARLMIEGFMSCFIFGFLATAGPRVLSGRHFSRGEVLRLVAMVLGSAVAHLVSRHTIGDGCSSLRCCCSPRHSRVASSHAKIRRRQISLSLGLAYSTASSAPRCCSSAESPTRIRIFTASAIRS
jgi:hypothetical protein